MRLEDAESSPGGRTLRRAALLLVLVGVGVALGVPARAAPSHAPREFLARPASGDGGEEAPPSVAAQPSPFAVGLRLMRFVDTTRMIRLKSGKLIPRTLLTYVRYPALAAPAASDVPDAPAATAGGPYPLVVFGGGFDVTPQVYSSLLQSWTSAGYVVAAPVFPLTSPDAPGGPDEDDVVNQPTDMSFVISSLLAQSASAASPLAGLIDPAEVAVAGHSDGAETALAVAFGRRFRDARVDAAMIFSGAEMSGVGGYRFPLGGPPLLAAQGTADRFNEPRYTNAYFKRAQQPKFLLRLLGAGHLPPFTYEQPQLAIVERVSLAFLGLYLRREPVLLESLLASGTDAGKSVLVADP